MTTDPIEVQPEVIFADAVYLTEDQVMYAQPGMTVKEALDACLPVHVVNQPNLAVFNHGTLIEDWDNYIVNENDRLLVGIVPSGGGGGGNNRKSGVIQMVVGAILIVVGAWTSWAGGTTLIQLGVGLMLSGLATLLTRPPKTSTNDDKEDNKYYQITGQSNEARPYQPVPRIYGRHKFFPNIIANPVVENIGTTSTLYQLFDFGTGDIEIDVNQILIGDTLASTLGAQFVLHRNTQNPVLQIVPAKVSYDQFSYVMEDGAVFRANTAPNSLSASVDIAFPRGLLAYNQNADGDRELTAGVIFSAYWRDLAGGGWNRIYARQSVWIEMQTVGCWDDYLTVSGATATGDLIFYGRSAKPFVARMLVHFPKAGQYEFYITRQVLWKVFSKSEPVADTAISLVKSYIAGPILQLQRPHTILEMRIVASEKLSGVVQNLSAVGTSVLPVYGPNGQLYGRTATRNNIWIALDVLLGEANPRPLSPSQIDWPSWRAAALRCDTTRTWNVNGQTFSDLRYRCDVVITSQTTVKDLVDSILSGARCSLMVTQSGLWGIAQDEAKTIPRQLITPANSWDFQGTRHFPDDIHAFKVSYIDASRGYQKFEVVCYKDGYDASNARNFEEVGTFGITTHYHAWAWGRYMMAQALMRTEVFTVKMDIENLAVQRNDLVLLQHDVPEVGGVPCRVVERKGNNVVVAQYLSDAPTGYSVRLANGTIRQGTVTAVVEDNEFTLDTASGIGPDDLIVLGKTNRVTDQYIVQSITAERDLTAELTLVQYVPGIYDADIGALPPWDPGYGDDLINQGNLAATILTITQETVYLLRQPIGIITINFSVNSSFYAKADVYVVVDGYSKKFLGSTDGLSFSYRADLVNGIEVTRPIVNYHVAPITRSGVIGAEGIKEFAVKPDRSPPSMPRRFTCNVQSELIELSWEIPDDPDVIRYELRYSPDAVNGIWNASQLIAFMPWDVRKTSVGARTGKYFIQAIDSSGNRSEIAWQRTTVETLPNINLLEEINDAPDWLGTMSGVVKVGAKIQSAGDWGAVVPEGYYYLRQLTDLGHPYEIRVSSKIMAHGITEDDFMINWHPVGDVMPLAKATSADWNVSLEYSTNDNSIPMASWVPNVADPIADPIAGTNGANWSPWRFIQVGDITGRFIKFRIKFESFNVHVKALLDDSLIVLDVIDRIWRANDVTIAIAGTRINFDPPFQEPPIVVVTIDGSQTASRYTATKDAYGVTINLYDPQGAQTAGQVDIAALGYGRERASSI